MSINKLDVSPNARKLIDSMRFLGYENKSAICDLIDNSIDANSRNIWLNINRVNKDDFTIEIVDDGIGMSEKILSQALRFGSMTERSTRSDLGRFGMGLTTASISMGRRIHVITKTSRGEINTAILDLDEMQERNNFQLQEFGPADSDDITEYTGKLGDSTSGTIVKISKSDGFKRMYVGSFQKDMIKHLGQIYRYFIRDAKINMFVNDELVPINDPLWLDHPDTMEYSNEVYEIKYKIDSSGEESEEPVRIRLVILPDHGGRQENKRAGYNADRSGFYILRNNREIASSQTLGLITRHPDFIRFRGEIFISGALDDVMGIEFTKRDVKPTQAVKDQLFNHIGGDLKSIRKHTKKDTEHHEEATEEFVKAEKYISSLSRLLLTPPPREGEQERSEGERDSGNNYGAGSKGTKKKKEEDLLNNVCKFSTRDYGEEGPIYTAEQRGKIIYIDLNISHPFYKRFVMENADADSKEKMMAAYYLIYSMAAAELRTFDEDQQEFITTFKSVLSINLRTLLSK